MEFERFKEPEVFVCFDGEFTALVEYAWHGNAIPTWGYTIWHDGYCVLGQHSIVWKQAEARKHCNDDLSRYKAELGGNL